MIKNALVQGICLAAGTMIVVLAYTAPLWVKFIDPDKR